MHRKRNTRLAPYVGLALLVSVIMPGGSLAQSGTVESGRQFAKDNCGRCHAIGGTDKSRLALAPPFRELHERYPVDGLQEALAEGIVTGHRDMPEFSLDPVQIDDFIAFLKSLE